MSTKNPLTLAGIEPATFRFVAQHLNHGATAVPNSEVLMFIHKFGYAMYCCVLKFESRKLRCKLFLRDNIIKTEHKEFRYSERVH